MIIFFLDRSGRRRAVTVKGRELIPIHHRVPRREPKVSNQAENSQLSQKRICRQSFPNVKGIKGDDGKQDVINVGQGFLGCEPEHDVDQKEGPQGQKGDRFFLSFPKFPSEIEKYERLDPTQQDKEQPRWVKPRGGLEKIPTGIAAEPDKPQKLEAGKGQITGQDGED